MTYVRSLGNLSLEQLVSCALYDFPQSVTFFPPENCFLTSSRRGVYIISFFRGSCKSREVYRGKGEIDVFSGRSNESEADEIGRWGLSRFLSRFFSGAFI